MTSTTPSPSRGGRSGQVRTVGWASRVTVAVPVGLKQGVAIDPVHAAAFVDLVHTVANSNEFAYRF